MNQLIYSRLSQIVDEKNILVDEPMKKHVTFRIGGPADFLVMPHTSVQVAQVIKLCKEMDIPFYIIGNGSNLLVSDDGFAGVVIQLYRNFSSIECNGEEITVQAGASNAVVARLALENSLTGYEFAAGIPGTIGGAVVMNAGAYGGEMKDVLTEVTVLAGDEIRVLPASELELGYRTSVIAQRGYIVLEAKLHLEKGNADAIRARMDELKEQRVSKQPLDYPSAGSTFKRPEGYFAGKLIMDAGLRGFTIGGAQVSEKHCGFVINTGDATAKDVVELMEQVSAIVKEKFGVTLEPEVKRLGDF